MSKTLGLILVTIGLGLTAGFGAFLSPNYRTALTVEGEATFSDAAVVQAFDEYCTSRKDNRLADREGCGESQPLIASAKAEGLSKVELLEAQVEALENSDEVLLIDVSMARVTYKVALKKSLKLWRTVESATTQGPQDRLTGWFGAGGVGFSFGLALLVLGAWMCRKAASAHGVIEGSSDAGPVDFGVLLASVQKEIAGLANDMSVLETPTVDALDAFKRRLEDVQKDEMARLCASGPLVQRRYGLHGMAALFSPLSAAERKMNRAWAALVDRHWPESLASVQGAAAELTSAQSELQALTDTVQEA